MMVGVKKLSEIENLAALGDVLAVDQHADLELLVDRTAEFAEVLAEIKRRRRAIACSDDPESAEAANLKRQRVSMLLEIARSWQGTSERHPS